MYMAVDRRGQQRQIATTINRTLFEFFLKYIHCFHMPSFYLCKSTKCDIYHGTNTG